MNSLQTIQKTFRIFTILTRIAYIFSIVGAVCCTAGTLVVVLDQTQWVPFRLFGKELILVAPGSLSVSQMLMETLSGTVLLITEAILLRFALEYLKAEQAEGTPFTENGADRLKKLGIRCIYMPIVATVICGVFQTVLDAEEVAQMDNLPSVAVGVFLILTAMIFRYGAYLEGKAKDPEGE